MTPIRSSYPIHKKPTKAVSPIPEFMGLSFGFQHIADTVKELENLKVKHEQDHKITIEEYSKQHNELAVTLSKKVSEFLAEAKLFVSNIEPPKGDTGNTGANGNDAPLIDEVALEERILARIPLPKNGETPLVDYGKIAKEAAKLISIPKPKDGKHADLEAIVEKVFELLSTGKKKLSVKHIGDFTNGLEQTIAPIRSLAAGFRGGGDTVAAGSGVTITTSNGVKTISASGGSANATYNEVVTGNTNTFTLAQAPTAGTVRVYALGQRLVLTTDYSIAAAVITTVSSWSAGQITADYNY